MSILRIVVRGAGAHDGDMKPLQPIRVYRHAISGHCHRVELYLSLLGLPHELIQLDLLTGAHKQPAFLAKNAFGQVPVIEDGDVTLADSNAILVYLGERYDESGKFWPRTATGKAAVQRWLSVASGPIAAGPAALRRARLLGAKVDCDEALRVTQQLFGVLESELGKRSYLVDDAVTIADLALYAYVARAPEGDVSLHPYPAISSWLARIEALPGFVPMLKSERS